jgi:gliding motility-associated-like protein
MRKFLLFLILTTTFISNTFGQDFSNKGKEFWLCFPNHVQSSTLGSLSVWITSDQASSGLVTISNGSFSAPFNIAANGIQEIVVPYSLAHLSNAESGIVVKKSIRIAVNAGQPAVVAYAQQWGAARSAATLLLPTNVLGKKYRAFSFTHTAISNGQNSRSQFQIIATLPNTQVQITPYANGVSGAPFTISLPVIGDIYQYQATSDVTGTLIESIASGTTGCSPIAVFSGNSAVTIGTPTCNGTSYDPLFQQCYPITTWGKNYGFIPFGDYTNGNPVRVMAAEDNTIVSYNGVVLATLNAGAIYPAAFTSNPTLLTQPTLITADKPISVAQYTQTSQCSGTNNGDPDMVLLNPIEQNISDITVFTSTQQNINRQWINVLIPTISAPSFKINGIAPSTAFVPAVNIPGYSYLKHLFTPAISGSKFLSADTGFNAILYGFQAGQFESYAYSAGTNVRDLNKNLEFENALSILNANSACTNSPVKFKIYLPDSTKSTISGITSAIRFDSMKWNITNPTFLSPNNFPLTFYGNASFAAPNNVGLRVNPDSLNTRIGKYVAWYSIQPPTNYTINIPGSYILTVTGYRTSTSDGCITGNTSVFEFPFIVAPPPVPSFDNNIPGCSADTVRFTETTPQGPIPTNYPTYKFYWDFGDPASGVNNTSALRNPVHKYSIPGSYIVKFKNITTPGCLSIEGTKTIVIPDTVRATITGTTTVCQSIVAGTTLPITFTGDKGLIPYTFTYTPYINGIAGASVDISSLSGLPTRQIQVPITTAGVYKFVLTNVRNADPLFCTVPITGQEATITVNPLPTATISGTINVCQNTGNQTVTFTGTGGLTATSIYQFTYIPTVNGVAGASQTINSNTAGIATVTIPSTTIGTFKYDLVSVRDVATTCLTTLVAGATTTATVFVQATPNATIVTNDTEECKDGTQPIITFTGTSANALPLTYTFYYHITTNGVVGLPQSINTTTATNIATLNVPVNTVATYIYTLDSVKTISGSATSCVKTFTSQNVTVKINPLPSATISGTATVCQAAGAQSVTLTGAGGTRPYKFTYTLNGGAPITVTSDPGVDTKVLTVSTAIGTYIYKITKVEDATATVCTQNYVAPNEPTATVIMQATSTATVTPVTTTVCQDATAPTITFAAANGTAPFEFTYTLTTNGVVGAAQTISSVTGSFTAPPITVPMGTAGAASTLVYTLIKVKNTGSIVCESTITGQTATVNINPIPTATIGTTTTVCQNSTAVPVTFTGFNATGGLGASYIFTYTVNNGAVQTTAAGNNIVVNQATTTANVFTYRILSVKDAVTNCIKNYTVATAPTTVITVKQLATATISSSVPTVCQNSTTLPVITFTASGGQAPFRFKYTITTNGVLGAVQTTPFTTVGSSLTLNAPTGTAGTYIYTLVSVEESANSCVNAQTGSTQVIVHPQPTASFTTTAPPYCALKNVTFQPTSGITPTGSVVSWLWNYDNGTGAQVRADGIDFIINYTTAGTKAVTFKVLSDKGCESVSYNQNVIINSEPVAGFKNPEACLADTYAQFTDTSTVAGAGASIVYWEWNFGDPGSPTNIVAGSTLAEKNPQHAYTFVGNKTVTLTVTSNTGCKKTVVQSFFINGEVTKANFIRQSANYCSNRPVQIKEASVVNVGGLIQVDIYWDNVGAPTVFEQDDVPTVGKIYTHSYPNLTTDATYKVRYIAYSGFNGVCQKDTTIDIVVRRSPVATFAPVLDVCLNGGPIDLTPYTTLSGGVGTFSGPGITTIGGVQMFDPLLVGLSADTIVTFSVVSPFSCDSAKKQRIKVLKAPTVTIFKTVGSTCIAGPGNVNVVTFYQESSSTEGGAIVKWIYDWGDGSALQTFTTAASAATVTHAYTTAGLKRAYLIVETAFGCRNAAPGKPVDFTVNPLPVPAYTPSASVCLPNASIQFANNTTPGVLSNYSFKWSFELPSNAAGDTSNAQNNPTHIYTTQGPYNTRLVATNILTGCKDSLSIVINSSTIHPKPVLVFGILRDTCLLNGNVTLNQANETSGMAGGPGIYTCVDVPAAVTSSGGVYSFNPQIAGAGVHTIKYFWTSSFGCLDTIKRTIKVLAQPVITSFITVGSTCIAGPGNVNVVTFRQQSSSTEGGAIVKWIYDWGDGSPLQTFTTGADVTHAYTTAGPVTAYLIVETASGCSNVIPGTNGRRLDFAVNPLPVPTYNFTGTFCLPNAMVQFNNTTQNIGANTYKWRFELPSFTAANVSNSNAPIVSHMYTSQGPFNTRLVATNILTGCTDTSAIQIVNSNTIKPQPQLTFGTIPDVCLLNGTVSITQATQTPPLLLGSGVYTCVDVPAAITTAGVFNPVTAGVGNHTIRYTYTTTTFNCSNFIEKTVKVLVAPLITKFETRGNLCEKNAIVFHNETSAAAGTIVSWIYNWGDGSAPQTVTTNGNDDITHVYANQNTGLGYTVKLTVVTDYGCKSEEKQINVKVNPIPHPTFKYTDTSCLPLAKIVFTNTTPPSVNSWVYNWNFDFPSTNPADINNIDFSPTHIYTNLLPHDVKLTATSPSTFCKNDTTVRIISLHAAPVANFNFEFPSVCIGAPIKVIDRSTWADGAATPRKWEWKWDDGANALGQTPAPHTYAVAKDYKVNLKITNSFGCVHDITKSFTVHPFPVVNAGRDSAILEGGQIVLTPTVTGNDLRYKWTGTLTPLRLNNDTILNPIASPTADITYTLTATARGGCLADDKVFIKVLKYPVIPNTFTPNNADSRHSYWDIQYLNSYPSNKVQVFTRTGQLVFESRGYKTAWDGSNLQGKFLPFDTYYYVIEPGSGRAPITGYVTIVK